MVGASWDCVAMVVVEFGCGCTATAVVEAGCDCIVKVVVRLGSASCAAHPAALTVLPPPQALTTTATR